MEREHLIIIALILVALYMMNNSSKDKVAGIGPAGRIRYEGDLPPSDMLGPPGPSYIRTREGFYAENDFGGGSYHIRLGDRDWGHSQHVKQHIRHNNRNNMFSGMMEGCGSTIPPSKHIETFRFACEPGSDQRDCA